MVDIMNKKIRQFLLIVTVLGAAQSCFGMDLELKSEEDTKWESLDAEGTIIETIQPKKVEKTICQSDIETRNKSLETARENVIIKIGKIEKEIEKLSLDLEKKKSTLDTNAKKIDGKKQALRKKKSISVFDVPVFSETFPLNNEIWQIRIMINLCLSPSLNAIENKNSASLIYTSLLKNLQKRISDALATKCKELNLLKKDSEEKVLIEKMKLFANDIEKIAPEEFNDEITVLDHVKKREEKTFSTGNALTQVLTENIKELLCLVYDKTLAPEKEQVVQAKAALSKCIVQKCHYKILAQMIGIEILRIRCLDLKIASQKANKNSWEKILRAECTLIQKKNELKSMIPELADVNHSVEWKLSCTGETLSALNKELVEIKSTIEKSKKGISDLPVPLTKKQSVEPIYINLCCETSKEKLTEDGIFEYKETIGKQ